MTFLFETVRIFLNSLSTVFNCCELYPHDECVPLSWEHFVLLGMNLSGLLAIFELINLVIILGKFVVSDESSFQRWVTMLSLSLFSLWICLLDMEIEALHLMIFVIHRVNMFLVYMYINTFYPALKKYILCLSVLSFVSYVFSL